MNKKVMLGISVLIIAVSCKFLKKSEPEVKVEDKAVNSLVAAQVTTNVLPPTSTSEPPLEAPKERPSKPDEKPITQYDSNKLDSEVREEALKLGKDPLTYRKIVRIEPDGTKIYRQIGMHVIVSPNKEEVFLPDEI